jgi:hypothetical protein
MEEQIRQLKVLLDALRRKSRYWERKALAASRAARGNSNIASVARSFTESPGQVRPSFPKAIARGVIRDTSCGTSRVNLVY